MLMRVSTNNVQVDACFEATRQQKLSSTYDGREKGLWVVGVWRGVEKEESREEFPLCPSRFEHGAST